MVRKEELIDLDDCVLNALSLFEIAKLPKFNPKSYKHPLVVGSGNAAVTGRILFDDRDAHFADEGSFKQVLKTFKGLKEGLLISASGGKHAPGIAKELKKRKMKTTLITCNEKAEARKSVSKSLVYPKNPEPYTYNTSTYLGMILAKTLEDPRKIREHIKKLKIPKNLGKYDAFYFILPERLYLVREMLLTKFDELFGSKITGRVFTEAQTQHAKTIVPNKNELFVYLGCDKDSCGSEVFGKNNLHINLSKNAGYVETLAAGYYFIGKIQKANPAWFKENLGEYVNFVSKVFGHKIEKIVK